jgi:hypothetical protein
MNENMVPDGLMPGAFEDTMLGIGVGVVPNRARSTSMGSMLSAEEPVGKGEILSLSLPLLHSKGMAVRGNAIKSVIDGRMANTEEKTLSDYETESEDCKCNFDCTPCPCIE